MTTLRTTQTSSTATSRRSIACALGPTTVVLLALFLVLLLPGRCRLGTTLEFPAPVTVEPMILREAK